MHPCIVTGLFGGRHSNTCPRDTGFLLLRLSADAAQKNIELALLSLKTIEKHKMAHKMIDFYAKVGGKPDFMGV